MRFEVVHRDTVSSVDLSDLIVLGLRTTEIEISQHLNGIRVMGCEEFLARSVQQHRPQRSPLAVDAAAGPEMADLIAGAARAL